MVYPSPSEEYSHAGGANERTFRMSAGRKDASVSRKGGYAALNINYKGSRADSGKHHGELSERGRASESRRGRGEQ